MKTQLTQFFEGRIVIPKNNSYYDNILVCIPVTHTELMRRYEKRFQKIRQ